MDSVFVVKDDRLEYLETHSEWTQRIFLKKGDQRAAVEAERVADRVFLHDPIRIRHAVFAMGSSLQTREGACRADSAGEIGDVIGFVRIEGEFSPDRGVERDRGDLSHGVIEVGCEDACTVIDQVYACRGGAGYSQAPHFKDHVRSLRIEAPDVAEAKIQRPEIISEASANLPAISGIGQPADN